MMNIVSKMDVVLEFIDDSCGYAAVLVDVVDSRAHRDRGQLQIEIVRAAEAVNRRIEALDPLTATVGDELQAIYPQPLVALRAVAELRLELIGTTALRAGIGWGDIVMHDARRTPFGQDGPAWWSARAALDAAAASSPRSGYEARIGIEFDVAEAEAEPADFREEPAATDLAPPQRLRFEIEPLIRSHVALLDRALASIDATEASIVLADLSGASTDQIADDLGLTPSAISQRRTRNRLRELVVALRLIDTAP